MERARAVLRWAAERSSIRAVAADAGVEQSVLNRFLSGNSPTRKPRPEVLERLLPHAARLEPEYHEAQQRSQRSASGVAVPAVRESAVLHLPSFWQGRMVGVRELLQNAMNAIQAADDEVRGLVESDVLLGGPGAPASPPMTAEAAISAVERSGVLDQRPPAAASDR